MTTLLLHFYADTEKELQEYLAALESKESDYEDYIDDIDNLPSFLNLPLSAGVDDARIDCNKNDDGSEFWIMQVVINYSFWAWFQDQEDADDDDEDATSVQLMCTSGLHVELADPTTGEYAYPHKFQQLVP